METFAEYSAATRYLARDKRSSIFRVNVCNCQVLQAIINYPIRKEHRIVNKSVEYLSNKKNSVAGINADKLSFILNFCQTEKSSSFTSLPLEIFVFPILALP